MALTGVATNVVFAKPLVDGLPPVAAVPPVGVGPLVPMALPVVELCPVARASTLFDVVELRLIADAQVKQAPIPKTIEQALALLAQLGGHVRNNGAPGWQTLARGYETLLAIELGWKKCPKDVINPQSNAMLGRLRRPARGWKEVV